MSKKAGIIIALLVVVILGISLVAYAGRKSKQATQKGQQLSRIEVYDADGTLLNVTQDRTTLDQFSELDSMAGVTDVEDAGMQDKLRGCEPLYTIKAYKMPAAAINDGKMEQVFTLTTFQNTNVIVTKVSKSAVKSFPVPSSYLTFYGEITDEEMQLIKSVATVSTQK